MQRSKFDIGYVDDLKFGRRVWHGFGSGLKLDVLREEIVAGVKCRGFRHSIAEIAVSLGVQATPTSRRRARVALACVWIKREREGFPLWL